MASLGGRAAEAQQCVKGSRTAGMDLLEMMPLSRSKWAARGPTYILGKTADFATGCSLCLLLCDANKYDTKARAGSMKLIY